MRPLARGRKVRSDFLGGRAVDAGCADFDMGHVVHWRVLAEHRLHLPVARLVDDDLRARHVLELEAREKERHAERVGIRNEGVPLVRVVRAPEREAELPGDAALKRRREKHVAEGHVLGAGNVDAAGDLVVDGKVGAGGENVAPAGGATLVRVGAHTAHEAVRDVLQRRVLDAFAIPLAPVEAFAGIMAEPELARRSYRFDLLRRGVGVDVHRIDAALRRRADIAHQPLVVLPELHAVAEALFGRDADLVERRGVRSHPAAVRMARVAEREPRRVGLVSV